MTLNSDITPILPTCSSSYWKTLRPCSGEGWNMGSTQQRQGRWAARQCWQWCFVSIPDQWTSCMESSPGVLMDPAQVWFWCLSPADSLTAEYSSIPPQNAVVPAFRSTFRVFSSFSQNQIAPNLFFPYDAHRGKSIFACEWDPYFSLAKKKLRGITPQRKSLAMLAKVLHTLVTRADWIGLFWIDCSSMRSCCTMEIWLWDQFELFVLLVYF